MERGLPLGLASTELLGAAELQLGDEVVCVDARLPKKPGQCAHLEFRMRRNDARALTSAQEDMTTRLPNP